MPDYDKTTRFVRQSFQLTGITVTIFDGSEPPYTCNLDQFKKEQISFGRGGGVDIHLNSHLVTHSKPHGFFVKRKGQWFIEDNASTNGLIYNNTSISSIAVSDGEFVRIDDGVETVREGVLLVFSAEDSESKWNQVFLSGKEEYTIGRGKDCDIQLPHISVSKIHAKIFKEKNGFFISDCGSTNGIVLNGSSLTEKALLHEKDVLTITNSKIIFTPKAVYFCCYKNGITVDAANVVVKRSGKDEKTHRRKKFITCNDVSLNIKPGELVAIIGGSGAGKSTVLNAMSGYLPPDSGEVYINGIDLYKNFDSLKKMIGYVPQSDIVYDNLTLYDMLAYTAKLRLPKDTSRQEREDAVTRAIELVELTEKTRSYIKSLSGGQRKRASIAVELLSDPNLLFLDEPMSGLDPGTERNMMHSLRQMADSGKTIILVTHSTLQLQLCDKIAFMGKGGNLCFFGDYASALEFFGIEDIVDSYNLITDHAKEWSLKFKSTQILPIQKQDRHVALKNKKAKNRGQLRVLCSRYMKLVMNDKQRLLLLLAQAPLLALLISLVASGDQFEQYEMTKSLLFAMSCSAFWIGMLNAIQEVCKERTITKREYMTGLSLGSYILSKMIVLGILCLIQSLLITGCFAIFIGLPEKGVLLHPVGEMLITTFLTSISSAAMGLFVSSLFTNADRAMTVAPILLMPQILFSGLIFELDGATKLISWFAICRWSMEGYGTTANLNELQLQLQQEGVMITHEAESFYDFTFSHLCQSWGILLLFCMVFLIAARVVLSSLGKEKA